MFVCLTGDRGHCRNAGEDDPLLGLARLIRRLARFVALRAADVAIRGQTLAQPRPCRIDLVLPHCPTGPTSLLSIAMCKEDR